MARVVVDVMLKPEILDPQGQAVANALPRLGVSDVASVRIGRRVEIEFSGEPDLDKAQEIADKLLANPVIEDFHIKLETGPAAAGDQPAEAIGAESVTDAAAAPSAAADTGDPADTEDPASTEDPAPAGGDADEQGGP